MPQAVWTGTLSFGLVSIPVKLYGASQSRDVRFHQFEGRTGRRVRYRRVANEADVPLWEDSRLLAPEQRREATSDAESRRPIESGPEPPLPANPEPLPAPRREPPGGNGWDHDTSAHPAGRPQREVDAPREVAFSEVVRGFEVDPGRFIEVTDEELEEFAPERSRVIEIEDFVRLAEIDPVYFEKGYHVLPARGGERTYRLLVRAMERAEFVAIARFVLRTREHVAAIRPAAGFLVLETLFRADEVRDPSTLPSGAAFADEPSKRELEVAVRLIEALVVDWDPARYPDDYRERVLEMIRGKAGPAPEREREPLTPGGEPAVFDLMEALKRSLEEARRSRGSASSPTTERSPRRRRSG
ncbi:MAG TPA: Ku protein [Actinomycetota bacterium]|nr:Ku protein [Actinomycetota bacterium]